MSGDMSARGPIEAEEMVQTGRMDPAGADGDEGDEPRRLPRAATDPGTIEPMRSPSPLPGISGVDPAILDTWLAERGDPRYRGRQVADFVWRRSVRSFDEMHTLPAALRRDLAASFRADTLADTEIRQADEHQTDKCLHMLADAALIESVIMRYPATATGGARATTCISSQVGCAVGCPFCATGELGFGRDLEAAEIVDQVRHAARRLGAEDRRLTNVVFMGMGEPLLNLDRVLEAATILIDPARFALGARRITISTSGVVPAMERLTALHPQFTLAVSLHAARDPLRDLLVPLNRRWPVAAVVDAASAYARATGRRVSYEYVMIDGINDTAADGAALTTLLAGRGAHVNLIPMNPVAHTPWRASPGDRIGQFADRLVAGGIPTTVRRNRGQEIGAACGQLAAERSGEALPSPALARRQERLRAESARALRGVRSSAPLPSGIEP